MKKNVSRKDSDVVLRVRVSDAGAAEIEVNPEKWNDPDVWGTLLADVAVTVAECYSTKYERKNFVATMEKAISRDLRDANKPAH